MIYSNGITQPELGTIEQIERDHMGRVVGFVARREIHGLGVRRRRAFVSVDEEMTILPAFPI